MTRDIKSAYKNTISFSKREMDMIRLGKLRFGKVKCARTGKCLGTVDMETVMRTMEPKIKNGKTFVVSQYK